MRRRGDPPVRATAGTDYTLGAEPSATDPGRPCGAGPVWANYHNGRRMVTATVRCNRPAGHAARGPGDPNRHAYSTRGRFGVAEWLDRDVVT